MKANGGTPHARGASHRGETRRLGGRRHLHGMSDAQRAGDSAPNGTRDFAAERAQLLARADAAQAQAATIDLDAAVGSILARTAAAADDAIRHNGVLAEGARAKIHEQQERFVAGVIASGGSLDEEVDAELQGRKDAPAMPSVKPDNKYAAMMSRRREQQQGR